MILEDYSKNVISDEGHQLNFDVSNRVEVAKSEGSGFKDLFEEFVRYKGYCADDDDIPSSPRHDQMKYASSVDFFGKDKPNHFPKPGAKNENLYHVHVFDGKTDAQLDKWIDKPQRQRSSNTLLFYSYFFHNGIYHFFILQFISNAEGDAHEYQRDNEKMNVVIQCAKEYRELITVS